MFVIILRLLYITRYVFGRRVDVSVPPRGAMFRETSGLMVGLVFPFSLLRRPGHKVDKPLCLAINREAKLTLNPGHYDQHEASPYIFILYIRSYILYVMLYVIYYILFSSRIASNVEGPQPRPGACTPATRSQLPSFLKRVLRSLPRSSRISMIATESVHVIHVPTFLLLLPVARDCYCCTSPPLLMLLLVPP